MLLKFDEDHWVINSSNIIIEIVFPSIANLWHCIKISRENSISCNFIFLPLLKFLFLWFVLLRTHVIAVLLKKPILITHKLSLTIIKLLGFKSRRVNWLVRKTLQVLNVFKSRCNAFEYGRFSIKSIPFKILI